MSKSKVFIAATRQNDGKTLVSMGLFHAFRKRFSKVSYMKPVGQQYKLIDGKKIDKDAVLFQKVYGIEDAFPDMSPIAVPPGFTADYIDNPRELKEKIIQAKSNLTNSSDFLLVEGTGHAGVGSVLDLSNADVAHALGAKVILVSLGGIGRAIDEIVLNKALFELKGVELLGVIINKVKQDKYEKVAPLVKKGLARHGIDVLGTIPYVPMLSKPTVATLFEELDGDLLTGEDGLANSVEKCVIGDMVPHDALDSFKPNTVLIVPANREGLIMTVLCGNVVESKAVYFISAIIFTGGHKPHPRVLDMVRHIDIPLMSVKEDSYKVATKINKYLVK
jgi:phosphate acetyltransferase